MRKGCLLLLLAFCLLFPAFFTAQAEPAVTRRALLVGCDEFVTQRDTSPSARQNAELMASLLKSSKDSFERVITSTDGFYSANGLAAAIESAFAGATENDISYLYISTHGIWENGEAKLLLSNGTEEEGITAVWLQTVLDRVPGKKILILDACNAGAFIGKGINDPNAPVCFAGEDYVVLTSAGGREESWYWSDTAQGGNVLQAGGYFTTALGCGLGMDGNYTADLNNDGAVTMTEIYDYMLDHYASSTPQLYPQNSDFVFFTYDPKESPELVSAVKDILFQSTVFTPADAAVTFEFTVQTPIRIACLLVYFQNGSWQFGSAKLVYDRVENMDGVTGMVSPGRKTRTLSLDDLGPDDSGYVMVLLLSIANNHAAIHSSTLLCVTPQAGDTEVEAATVSSFSPGKGQEAPIVITTAVPCRLTVTVQDESGKTVRYLSYLKSTRPNGTGYYWNGKDASGKLLPPGRYRFVVSAVLPQDTQTVITDWFTLNE